MSHDWLIVGAGFAGSVMARELAEAGKSVLIIDKRDHIGGNAYDYVNEHGVRIHKYGPHIFHTNSDAVFSYLSRFTEWRPYEHRVLASVEGKLVPFPVNLTTLEMLGLTKEDCAPAETITHPRNAEEQCLQRVGRKLYELFFEGYTTKMWGRHPRELDASVTARIPVRWDSRDDRYFTDTHQCMPKDGYTALFERMLGHKNIEVQTGVTAHGDCGRPTIWTGPIDEYFDHRLGYLPYRSIQFDYQSGWFNGEIATGAAATINFPTEKHPRTRATEWRALAGEPRTREAFLTFETPRANGDPYYPIPAPANRALYKRHEELAERETDVVFLGRLGTYQYLNMDQAVGQALAVARRILA